MLTSPKLGWGYQILKMLLLAYQNGILFVILKINAKLQLERHTFRLDLNLLSVCYYRLVCPLNKQ